MNKEKAGRLLPVVLITAAVIMTLLALLLRMTSPDIDVSTVEGRQSFLAELGWEIDPESEEQKSIYP